MICVMHAHFCGQERKVVERRSSLLITEDDPLEELVISEQPRDRQSVLDSFFS